MILGIGCLLNVYDISDEGLIEKYLGNGCAMPSRLTDVIVEELVRYISEKI